MRKPNAGVWRPAEIGSAAGVDVANGVPLFFFHF